MRVIRAGFLLPRQSAKPEPVAPNAPHATVAEPSDAINQWNSTCVHCGVRIMRIRLDSSPWWHTGSGSELCSL